MTFAALLGDLRRVQEELNLQAQALRVAVATGDGTAVVLAQQRIDRLFIEADGIFAALRARMGNTVSGSSDP